MNYAFTVHYSDFCNPEYILNILKEWGVIIVKEVLPDYQADILAENSVNEILNLCPELSKTNYDSWGTNNTPDGPRWGMYQQNVGHFETAYDLRTVLFPYFQALYGTSDLMTSIDGASIFPPKKGSRVKDWAHIDSTKPINFDNFFEDMVIQSQIVLTNTSAAFRCTPKSHLYHQIIMQTYNIPENKQWHKFEPEIINNLEQLFKNNNICLDWQIPIYVNKGDAIFWLPQTIHSAQRQNFEFNNFQTNISEFDNWRIVYYIAMLPKFRLSKTQIQNINKAIMTGKLTNHDFTKLHKLQRYIGNKSDHIQYISKNPWNNCLDKIKRCPILSNITGLVGG